MTYKIICNIKTINKCKNYLLNVNGFPEIKVPVLVICYFILKIKTALVFDKTRTQFNINET
jgi:hypothetical protein